MNEPFLKIKALLVRQPLGEFFLCKIKAEDLLKVTFSSEFRLKEDELEETLFIGNQRQIKIPKSKQIGTYIDSVESAFPNSIILAANYNNEGEEVTDENIKWTFIKLNDDLYEINVPTHQKVISIIDGQHRLEGFRYIENTDRLETELVCSLYFGLPNSYQAYLFANINGTQTPVNKNLTYNLYGFNLEKEDSYSWSPEKLSVFITRKINFNKESPFYKRIKISPNVDDKNINESTDWLVSTATMVEGIVSLISKRPKRDQDALAKLPLKHRKRSTLNIFEDESPLRRFYLAQEDTVIEKTVENFFNSADKILFSRASTKSFIFKNIGFKALFTLLFQVLSQQLKNNEINVSEAYFEKMFKIIEPIDFSQDFFRVSSYVGKARMENIMLIVLKLRNIKDIRKAEDMIQYENILKAAYKYK